MVDNAAFAFTEYCLREVEQKNANSDDQIELYNAFQYLAHYHLKKGCLDDAYANAYKCLEHEEVFLHFFFFKFYLSVLLWVFVLD